MSRQYRHFTVREKDEVSVIELTGPRIFGSPLVSELEEDLLDFIESNQPRRVLIDFSRVTHCTTAVINGFLRAKKRLVEAGGKFYLSDMTDPIRDGYRMLNLDGTVFRIYEDRASALVAMRG